MTIASVPPPQTVPSTPDPAVTAIVYSIIRSVLAIASGLGIGLGAFGHLPDSALMIVAGGVAGIIVGAWSLYEKFQAAKQAHANSVQSANIGAPVKIAA